jgi:flavin-dependent dehydrogenase
MAQVDGLSDGTANGVQNGDSDIEVFTDYLIVGTGPAGASLACFLTQHGECTNDHAHYFATVNR